MMRIVRAIGMAVGLLIMAVGLWLLFYGGVAPAIVFTVEGLVVVLGVVFERAHLQAAGNASPRRGMDAHA